MKGFKAFNNDLTCRRFQYEIGKIYEMKETPKLCERGFHFCRTIAECYNYYDMNKDTRICEVEALGEIDVKEDGDKLCTNKIKILSEVTTEWQKKGNATSSNTGYCNTGNRNTGDCNTGNRNTGNCNTGNRNTGDCNTGDCNTGDWNTGNRNTGDYNTGDYNTGDCNTGDYNTGDYNTGDCNTGDYNTGDYNTGDYNTGDYNAGIFCTDKNPTIKIFDKESNWTMQDWLNCNARYILNKCPVNTTTFIDKNNMTEEEKREHPKYEAIGGYLKIVTVSSADKQAWWNDLNEEEKQEVLNLPNFNKNIFLKCTGIKIN